MPNFLSQARRHIIIQSPHKDTHDQQTQIT